MTTPALIPWREAVAEAKQIVSRAEKDLWRLAELAAKIQPIHDEGTLAKFAEEIDLELRTVEKYRQVYQRFSQNRRVRRISFSAAYELVSLPQEEIETIIADQPNLSFNEARSARRERSQRRRRSRRQAAIDVNKCAEKTSKALYQFFNGDGELDQYAKAVKENVDELDVRTRNELLKTTEKLIERLERFKNSIRHSSNLIQIENRRRT